ncbi:MAG: PD40 domain-containing protein [Acidobacteria bacterium]|nr:PD40 domain-containing protein [Acidobacteriota bacterium]
MLSERLRKGPIPAEEGLRLSIEIGSAIRRAHVQGKVHGGLCPFCIVLTEKAAVLTDPPSSPVDRAPYRSPEEFAGERPDTRSDIFAFGAILYEIITSRRAFPGAGEEMKNAIVSRGPQPFKAKSLIHTAMKGVMDACLERDRGRRRQRIQNAVIELKMCRTIARNADLMLRMRALPPAADAAPGAVPVPRVRTAAPQTITAAPAVVLGTGKTDPMAWGRKLGAWVNAGSITAASEGLTAYAGRLSRRSWLLLGVALLVTVSAVAAVVILRGRSTQPTLQFSVSEPENTSYPGMPAVSPDGRFLTFSAVGQEGKRMLWLRPLDALHATMIPGTEGASSPFWSPDSAYVAFFADRSLKRVRVSGETAPETICAAEAEPGGGAWNKDGTILFSPGLANGFYQVRASGGRPQAVLKLDESNGERADLWPQFLPDGKHFVYYQLTDLPETSGVYSGSLDSKDHRKIFNSQTNAVYSNGYLLYINERSLMAQPFNPDKLEVKDAPVTLGTDIGALRSLSLAPISVSATGALVYQGVGKAKAQVVWTDRSGRQLATSGGPGEYGPPRLSPAGDRAAVAKLDPDGKLAHLWLLGQNGTATQISSGPQHEGAPVWSPDGSRLAYFGRNGQAYDLYQRPAAPGGKAELLDQSPTRKFPTDWSHDGRYLLFYEESRGTRLDIWGFSMLERRPAPIVKTVYTEGFATLSPNGRWLAFQSDQSGHNDVYVEAFDGLTSGTKKTFLVAQDGGLPHWRGDGNEVYYITAGGSLMAVQIHEANGSLQVAKPQKLFQTRPLPGTWNLYDVSADGQRFVFKLPLEWTSSAPITVVTNWVTKLKE